MSEERVRAEMAEIAVDIAVADADRHAREIAGLTAKVTALEAELAEQKRLDDEQGRLFNAMWDADMRGIALWQAAHPGKEKVWPDRSKLVLWLLEEIDRLSDLADTYLQYVPDI